MASAEQGWAERIEVHLHREEVVTSHKLVSLRTMLVVVGCFAVLSVGLIVFGICYASGIGAVERMEADLQSALSTSITQNVEGFVLEAVNAINCCSETIRMHALHGNFNVSATDASAIRKILLPYARQYRQFLPGLYMGFPSGYFVGYAIVGANFTTSQSSQFTLTEHAMVGSAVRFRWNIDPIGNPTTLRQAPINYSSIERPWYQAVALSKAPLFTEVYSISVSAVSLGITIAVPIFQDLQPPPFFSVGIPADVRLTGPVASPRLLAAVLAVDMPLQYLNELLASLKIGKSGETFVLDEKGFFVLTSVSDRIGANTTLLKTHSTLVKDALVNATMERLLIYRLAVPINRDNYSDYARLQDVSDMSVVSSGATYSVAVTFFALLKWRIVVLVPESDYLSPAKEGFYVGLYVALAIVLISTAAFLVFSFIVTRPIYAISKNMILLRDLKFESKGEIQGGAGSKLSEIDSMQQSFSRLKVGLQSFSRYVPLSVVRRLMESNQSAVLGLDVCEATVFFSDIEGFTSITEMIDSASLVEMLDEYFSAMVDCVTQCQGIVIDYFGDAILASWNAPLQLRDHYIFAVRSALLQQQELARLRLSWAERNLPQLRVRMGLTIGSILAGNIGSSTRMKYTLMGDRVNLASRCEGLNKQYGTYVTISGALYDLVKHAFVCRFIDVVRVVGKSESTRIYEVLMERMDGKCENAEYVAALELESMSVAAFDAFRSRDWLRAKSLYSAIGGKHGQVFLERIAALAQTEPPADWDGVCECQSK